jgi:iron complex outermembrane receptor protein
VSHRKKIQKKQALSTFLNAQHATNSIATLPQLVSLGTLLLAGSMNAMAESPSGETGAMLSAVTVTADAQREAHIERKNAALQKIVIGEEEVERYGDATVGDVLRRLPGMGFTGPAGVAKDLRMRGMDKGYTQFLINGESVPGATQERQMQVDRLAADMIERIEIIRNPTAEFDASGIGGTINIVLKNRAEDLTRLRAAYGKNGNLDVGDVIGQWSRRFDNLDVVLALSHTVGAEDVVEDKNKLNASGAITAREHKPKPVKKTETLFTPRLTWRLGEDRLTLEPFMSVGTEDKLETSQVRTTAGALTKGTTNNEDKTDQITRLAGRYDAKAAWGTWYAKLGVQQGKSDKDKFTTEANGAGVLTKRSQEYENIQDDQSYVGAGVALPLGAHFVKAGLEQRDVTYEKHKTTAEASNATAALKPKAAGANDIYNIKESKSVAYLQDEWRVGEAHWLTPGIRYESTARHARDRNGTERSGSQASPNPSLHYRWAVNNNTNIRASVAQTLRFPKFDDVNPLVTLDAGSITKPDKGGNADLKPERATGIELGIERFFMGHRGIVGFNLYNRDVKDFIQKSTLQEGARFVERPYNAGNAHFWGAELDWRVPLMQKSAHELSFTGSHAELRGTVSNARTGGTSGIKDLPPRITNIGMDWRHLPSKWSAGFAVNYSPSFTTDGLNPEGVREVKSRNESTLLDLFVSKIISAKAEFRLVAKNVLGLKKEESTTKYNANGSFASAEAKIESSEPTIFLTFESRF